MFFNIHMEIFIMSRHKEIMEDIENEKSDAKVKAFRMILVGWAREHQSQDSKNKSLKCLNVRFQHIGGKPLLQTEVRHDKRDEDPDKPSETRTGPVLEGAAFQETNSDNHDVVRVISIRREFERKESHKISVGAEFGFSVNAGVPGIDIGLDTKVGMSEENDKGSVDKTHMDLNDSVELKANTRQKVVNELISEEYYQYFTYPVIYTGKVVLWFNRRVRFDQATKTFFRDKNFATTVDVPIDVILSDIALRQELELNGLFFVSSDSAKEEVCFKLKYTHITIIPSFRVRKIGEPEALAPGIQPPLATNNAVAPASAPSHAKQSKGSAHRSSQSSRLPASEYIIMVFS